MKTLLQIINTDNEPNILMDMDNQSNKKANFWEKTFSIGYACACANIIRTHGEETIARDCFNENFMSVETMKAIGVDEDDIKVLEPIVKEIERKQSVLA